MENLILFEQRTKEYEIVIFWPHINSYISVVPLACQAPLKPKYPNRYLKLCVIEKEIDPLERSRVRRRHKQRCDGSTEPRRVVIDTAATAAAQRDHDVIDRRAIHVVIVGGGGDEPPSPLDDGGR